MTAGRVLLDVPAAEYQRRELGVATSGVLQRLRTMTPAHVAAWAASDDEGDTPAKVFGRAYHCAVLEPAVFARSYALPPPADAPRDLRHLRGAKSPSQSTLDAIAWWDAWDDANAGKIQLSREDFLKIEAMRAALMANPLAAAIFADGLSEVTLRWVDEETGVPCKARADWWCQSLRFFVDLKTTDDASEAAFSRSIASYGYHVQDAHYTAGATACGIEIDAYLIVAQEKEPPYLAAVYALDVEAVARGAELRQRGLRILKACSEAQQWPGYATGINYLSLPAWALRD